MKVLIKKDKEIDKLNSINKGKITVLKIKRKK